MDFKIFQTLDNDNDDDGRAPRHMSLGAIQTSLKGEDLSTIWRQVRLSLRSDPGLTLSLGKVTPALSEVTPDEAARLMAFCTIQSLAYDDRRGDIASIKKQIHHAIASMGKCRAWVASTLYTLIDPETLTLPRSGRSYSSSHRFGDATFEQPVLLVSSSHTALLIWEDED